MAEGRHLGCSSQLELSNRLPAHRLNGQAERQGHSETQS